MKLLLTGACGYVGSSLTPLLLEKGYQVRAIDTQWFGNSLDPHENLEIIKLDIRELSEEHLEGIDAVIHLANIANDPGVELNPTLSWEVNVLSSQRLAELALKYDQTVPFARVVVQNQNELTFPFKRYQIQPVWRADRPQKGRYREFYQCDADIVGTNSLNCEIELVGLISEVLNDLNLSDHTIMINNRKILSALISLCNSKEYFSKITVIIDKIDKIGIGKVIQELRNSIPNNECAELFNELFKVSSSTSNTINWLENKFQNNEEGKKGLQELKHIIHLTKELGIDNLEFNISLARGLDYYTGSIFEVVLNNSSMGSIVGGGRYDNLTKVFGQNDLSGVGISFGAERIYDLMNGLNLFPTNLDSPPKYMIIDQS